jgi:hypothetical protein
MIPKPDRYAKREQRIDYTKLAHPKVQPVRDAGFRAFVRRRACSIFRMLDHKCGPRVNGLYVIDFAHVGKLGLSIKASDEHGIPLCHDAHMEQTAMGWKRFAVKYGIAPLKISRALWDAWNERRKR